MMRERIVRAALRAYPATVQRSQGREMLATLLDSSDGSTRAFIVELFGLLRGGLRSRACSTAAAPIRRVIADGFCLAWVLWIALALCTVQSSFLPSWQFWLAAAALALALVGYDRLAGLVGLVWIAFVLAPEAISPRHIGVVSFLHLGVAAFLFAMILAPRRRTRDLRALLWLAPIAAAAYASSLDPSVLRIAAVAVSLAGLASLPTNPRLAIAIALVWTSIGIAFGLNAAFGHDGGASPRWAALAATGPIVVTFAVARVRQLRRQTRA